VLDLVSGVTAPDRGRVSLHGDPITTLTPDQRARLGLGRSFQDARLFPALAGRDGGGVARGRHHPNPTAFSPTVLLLDEPSAGVAQRDSEALFEVISGIRDQTGAALVVIEHDMALIQAVCDRLVAMELGAVIAQGTPADVLGDERVVASYLGRPSPAARPAPKESHHGP
jgi:ABC-type branched-subunit amino acid transport system ATPase component